MAPTVPPTRALYDGASSLTTDSDGDVDSSDAWRHNQYNERWQLVGVYLNANAKPSEVYSFHNAGRDGFGGGSYIDWLVCSDRDKDVDGSIVREERIYYVQNWRHDVVALVRADSTTDQKIVERIRYDAYGRPSSFSPADTARSGGVIGPDGAVDTNDDAQSVLGSGAQWYNDYASGSLGASTCPTGPRTPWTTPPSPTRTWMREATTAAGGSGS